MSDPAPIPEPTPPGVGAPKHLAATGSIVASILAGQFISPWSTRTTATVSVCTLVAMAVVYGVHRLREELRYRREILAKEREEHRREHVVLAELLSHAMDRIEALEARRVEDQSRADKRWKDTKTISVEKRGREFVQQILDAPEGSYGATIRDGFVPRSEPRSGFSSTPTRGVGQTKLSQALAAAGAGGRPGAEHRLGGPRPGDPT
jgi:hypothetical protein